MRRRDFLKAGMGSAVLLSVPRISSAALRGPRSVGNALLKGPNPAPMALQPTLLPRLPLACQTDYRQSVVGAPVAPDNGPGGSSQAYIGWHVLNGPSRGRTDLSPASESWDGLNRYYTLIPYDPLNPTGVLTTGVHPIIQTDGTYVCNNVPYLCTDVHPIVDPRHSDGVGPDGWARNYYRIPPFMIDQPRLFQAGSPGIARQLITYHYDHHAAYYNSQDNLIDEFYQLEWNGPFISVRAGDVVRNGGSVTVTTQPGVVHLFHVGDQVSLFFFPDDPNYPSGIKQIVSINNNSTQFTYLESGGSNQPSTSPATATQLSGANWECYIACRFNCSSIQASRRPPIDPNCPVRYGPTAGGLSMIAGTLTYDEFYNTDNAGGAGDITHGFFCTLNALGATGPDPSGTPYYCYPASAAQTLLMYPGAIPMGARLRLKADYDETAAFGSQSGFSLVDQQAAQRYCRALKTYGLIVMDGGGQDTPSGTGRELSIASAQDLRWDAVAEQWVLAFRYGTRCWLDYRRNTTFFTGRPATPQPSFEDFEVIQLGYPVEAAPGRRYLLC